MPHLLKTSRGKITHGRRKSKYYFCLCRPHAPVRDEDERTLAAIDEGIRDAKAGRTVSSEEVRKLLPKWTTASSTRKDR
jgi:hypothetical protein